VDLGGIETQPVYNPTSQLVYATGRDKVTDVWVAGRQVVSDRQLTTMDSSGILNRAAAWQKKIAASNH
jgi:5-methylthioadenosine/S-adenosylhomocysteine deaminase